MSLARQTLALDANHSSVEGPSSSGQLRSPYMIYFGDVRLIGFAKTGLGLIEWRPELCAGQMRAEGCLVDGGLTDMSVEEAVRAGVKSLVIGVASPGGTIPSSWISDLANAARAGLDIVSGMHARLSSFPEIVAAAALSGSRLVDVRTPPKNIPVGTGQKRTGKRLLTVGTDCAVGKKYTALAIEKEMRSRGWDADFRATGQTGILISGGGIVIDSVVSDFLSGAAESLTPSAAPEHWDVIEGQGALAHPSYAGVSLGLLHGSQPDALVLCHDPSRDFILGLDRDQRYPIQSLTESMAQCLIFAKRVNPNARFVGIAVNTSRISDNDRMNLKADFLEETGLPVTDPIRDGVGAIVDRIQSEQF